MSEPAAATAAGTAQPSSADSAGGPKLANGTPKPSPADTNVEQKTSAGSADPKPAQPDDKKDSAETAKKRPGADEQPDPPNTEPGVEESKAPSTANDKDGKQPASSPDPAGSLAPNANAKTLSPDGKPSQHDTKTAADDGRTASVKPAEPGDKHGTSPKTSEPNSGGIDDTAARDEKQVKAPAKTTEDDTMDVRGEGEDAPEAKEVDVAADASNAVEGAGPEASLASGKRDRRRPKIFDASTSAAPSKRRRQRKAGTGTKLGDIPNIAFQVNNSKGRDEELILLHRVLFASVGTNSKRKASIRSFTGYVFDTPAERERLKDRISKIPGTRLKKVAQLLDLPSTTLPKNEMVTSIVTFLENPQPRDDSVDLAARAQRKKERRAKKRARASDTKGVAGKRKRKASVSKANDTDSESAADEDDDQDEDNEDELVSRVFERDETQKKAKKQTTTKRGRKPKNASKRRKAANSDSESSDEIIDEDDQEMRSAEDEDVVESDHDSKDDAKPEGNGTESAPKGSNATQNTDGATGTSTSAGEAKDPDATSDGNGPSEAQLDAAISKLLAEGDASKLTVRSIRTSLEAQFGQPLQSRMTFLRECVRKKLEA